MGTVARDRRTLLRRKYERAARGEDARTCFRARDRGLGPPDWWRPQRSGLALRDFEESRSNSKGPDRCAAKDARSILRRAVMKVLVIRVSSVFVHALEDNSAARDPVDDCGDLCPGFDVSLICKGRRRHKRRRSV